MGYTVTFLTVFLNDLAHLSPILLSLLAAICLLGLTIGRIEGWGTGASLYHAFINATTVGYGDLRPQRGLSRLLAVLNAMIGLLFFGVFVGIGVHAVETAAKGGI